MEIFFIVGLILIIAAVLIFLFLKKVVKTILFVLLISGMLLGAAGYFAYRDAMDLKENLLTARNLFLLEEDDELIAGFEFSVKQKEPLILGISKLNVLNSNYREKDYKSMLEDNYKMFIFEREVFDEVDSVKMDSDVYPKEFIYRLFDADDAVEVFVDYQIEKKGFSEEFKENVRSDVTREFGDSTHLKGVAFGVLFQTANEDRGPLFIIENYKEKHIMIYPETMAFKFVKILPLSWIKKIMGEDR